MIVEQLKSVIEKIETAAEFDTLTKPLLIESVAILRNVQEAHASIQDNIKSVLNGIDKTEQEDPNGWWETSTGAEFGASKLNDILNLFDKNCK